MGGRKRAAAPSMVQQSKQLAAAHKRQKVVTQLQQEKDKVDAQRKLTKKKAKARSPYKPHHTVLLIGEGNFSFARSIIDSPPSPGFQPLPGSQLTATCYDSFAVARDKYADVQDNIDALRAAGARVWDNIDATRLHDDSAHFPSQPSLVSLLSPPPLSHYDFIVFNFPHTGSGITDTHKNVEQHRHLLIAFLHSLARSPHLLSPTTRVHVTVKTGEPYTSWRVPLLPRSMPTPPPLDSSNDDSSGGVGVRFVTSVPFYPHLYPHYQHRRTIGYKGGLSADGNEDIEGGAKTHVFMRATTAEHEHTSRREATLPAADQPAATPRSETEVDESARWEGSESDSEDDVVVVKDELATQQVSLIAEHKAASKEAGALLPVRLARSKLSGRANHSSKPKVGSQPKAKLNLRGLLFT